MIFMGIPMKNSTGLLALVVLLFGLGIGHTSWSQDPNRSEIVPTKKSNAVTVNYVYDSFFNDIDDWNQLSASLSRRIGKVKVIGRINAARRFSSTGNQFEVDAYPSFYEGAYGYFNVGYSQSSIFPHWRMGGEYFQSLPDSFEASLGFRQLQFTSSTVFMYTGTLSKYWGNYLFSIRPYYIPSSSGNSLSGSLSVRRYWNDLSYIAITVGQGYSADTQVSTQGTFQSSSYKIGIDTEMDVGSDYLFSASLGFSKELVRPEVYRNDLTFGVGITYLF